MTRTNTQKAVVMAAIAFFSVGACSEYKSPLNGDLNRDGHLSISDLELLEELIASGSDNSAGDLNTDGKVDQSDLEALKTLVCEANGARMNVDNECCITGNDGTACCDKNFDGDFNDCKPPDTPCTQNEDCSALNCPALCDTQSGSCVCQSMCAKDEDCIALNCSAFCNPNGECECKNGCATDEDCGFISKCRSVCGPAGYCVCADECVGEGERFVASPSIPCCPGLSLIEYAIYQNGQCAYVDCACFVCAVCGNGVCGPGENPCNCPADCPEPGCTPGDTLPCDCQNNYLQDPPCFECDQNGKWQQILYFTDPCHCLHWTGCQDGFVCDGLSGRCMPDCRQFDLYCPPGQHCDPGTGLCVADCLGEGGRFEGPNLEGKCCEGLLAVPDVYPEQGTCVGPNCLCYVCTRCGTDGGVCSLEENSCNCPTDCPEPGCTPGDTLPCDCQNNYLQDPPCFECDQNGKWQQIVYFADPCHCLHWTGCKEGFTCNAQTGLCEPR